MDVVQLHQRIAGGVSGTLLLAERLPDIQPAKPGRSQRMVPVAHGHGHVSALSKGADGFADRFGCLAADAPAGNVAALLHEIKVIDLFKGALFFFQRPQHPILRIVHQHHGMGHFQRRTLSHLHTGRHTVGNGVFRGADGGTGAGRKVILLQIHRTHKTTADASVALLPLQIDKGVLQHTEHVLTQAALHLLIDAQLGTLGPLRFQPGLRQHQPQGGIRIAHQSLALGPVSRLGGELVTGDHGPAFHGGVGWDEYVGSFENIHQFCPSVVTGCAVWRKSCVFSKRRLP